MINIKTSELKEEHKYCPYCGGFVDFSNYKALLVYPVIKQYFCSSCNKIAISIQDKLEDK